MRIIISLLLGLSFFISSATNISRNVGDEEFYDNFEIVLYVEANPDSIGNGLDPALKGQRSLPSIYLSTLSHDNGIYINGINTEDILLCEIYDSNRNCLGIFQDEETFLEMLFSLTGTFEVRFVLEDFTLTGMITI